MIRGKFARYNKLWLAAAGVAAQLITDGFITGEPETWVTTAIAAVTALGVFAVPNAEA